jgi:ribonuclease D
MPDPTRPTDPPVVVTTPEALRQMVARLQKAPAVAVDTEANSFYAYYERVCLIQLTFDQTDYIVDPLALTNLDVLGPIFADPAIEKIFHAAEYDLIGLKRDYQFEFGGLFDTMIASRIVGRSEIGLAAVLEEQFGVHLNKRWQRADWGRRPLPPEQLAYARLDTHYLLPLRDVLLTELRALGREEEAREEFARLAQTTPTPHEFDPKGFWRIKGARDLSPREVAVLRELYLYRDQQARHRNRPPFKIFSNAAMVRVSQNRPLDRAELARIKGMSDYVVRRYGNGILRAVTRGLRARPPQRPRSSNNHRPDEATLARLEALKAWRKARAKKRGVDPDVVLSNATLMALARRYPRTEDELVTVPGLGDWKRREYGTEIIQVLRDQPTSRRRSRRRGRR